MVGGTPEYLSELENFKKTWSLFRKLEPLQWYSGICGFILYCFELQQIRDHFYYTNGGHLYGKSGLRFAVTQLYMKNNTLYNVLY